jgi:hypothetical protein
VGSVIEFLTQLVRHFLKEYVIFSEESSVFRKIKDYRKKA